MGVGTKAHLLFYLDTEVRKPTSFNRKDFTVTYVHLLVILTILTLIKVMGNLCTC